MKFAFIMNSFDSVNPDSDTTVLFIEESLRRNHETYWLSHNELELKLDVPYGFVRKIDINRDEKVWWKYGESNLERLDSFDVVFIRHDPPFNEKYLTEEPCQHYITKVI